MPTALFLRKHSKLLSKLEIEPTEMRQAGTQATEELKKSRSLQALQALTAAVEEKEPAAVKGSPKSPKTKSPKAEPPKEEPLAAQ